MFKSNMLGASSLAMDQYRGREDWLQLGLLASPAIQAEAEARWMQGGLSVRQAAITV